jgi:hypothetical protein
LGEKADTAADAAFEAIGDWVEDGHSSPEQISFVTLARAAPMEAIRDTVAGKWQQTQR